MNVPESFARLARGFYQGSDREYPTMVAWIRATLEHLDSKEQRVVKAYLTKLLGDADDDELQRVWNGLGSDYYFRDGEHSRRFLSAIVAEIK